MRWGRGVGSVNHIDEFTLRAPTVPRVPASQNAAAGTLGASGPLRP